MSLTRLVTLAVTAIGATGCGDLFVPACERGEFVTVGLTTPSPSTVMYPGDHANPWASLAKGNRNEPACAKLVYATWTGSTAFQFTSRNPAVASVVGGRVTANSVGKAWIVGTTAGLSDSLQVWVTPRVATLRLFAVPAKARAGDTVVVTLEPRDSTGAIVADAYVYGPIFVSPSPYPSWIPPGFSSLTGRFVMPAVTTIIRSSAPHFTKEVWADLFVTPP